MQYEPINQSHAEAVAALEVELFDNAFSEHTLRKEIEAGWGFVAVDEEVVGYALVRESDDLADLTRLAVRKDRQGQGIGTHLLSLVLENVRNVMLCVRKENQRSLALYKAHGFSVVGYIDNSWVMQRRDTT